MVLDLIKTHWVNQKSSECYNHMDTSNRSPHPKTDLYMTHRRITMVFTCRASRAQLSCTMCTQVQRARTLAAGGTVKTQNLSNSIFVFLQNKSL